MSDLNFQKFSTVLPEGLEVPRTIASANVISVTSFLTILTGNVVIKTITPPLAGVHMIAILFAGVAGVDNTDNIGATKASVAGEVMLLVYNPINAHYYPVG